jgi:hypothetical protein
VSFSYHPPEQILVRRVRNWLTPVLTAVIVSINCPSPESDTGLILDEKGNMSTVFLQQIKQFPGIAASIC